MSLSNYGGKWSHCEGEQCTVHMAFAGDPCPKQCTTLQIWSLLWYYGSWLLQSQRCFSALSHQAKKWGQEWLITPNPRAQTLFPLCGDGLGLWQQLAATTANFCYSKTDKCMHHKMFAKMWIKLVNTALAFCMCMCLVFYSTSFVSYRHIIHR